MSIDQVVGSSRAVPKPNYTHCGSIRWRKTVEHYFYVEENLTKANVNSLGYLFIFYYD